MLRAQLDKRKVMPNQVLKGGQVVEVVVLDVDLKERRIALSIRELSPNPWEVLLDG